MALSIGAIGLVGLLALVFLPKGKTRVGSTSGIDERATEELRETIDSVAISSSEKSRPKSTYRKPTIQTPLNINIQTSDSGGGRSDKDRHAKIASFTSAGFLAGTAVGASKEVGEGLSYGAKWALIILACFLGYKIIKRGK